MSRHYCHKLFRGSWSPSKTKYPELHMSRGQHKDLDPEDAHVKVLCAGGYLSTEPPSTEGGRDDPAIQPVEGETEGGRDDPAIQPGEASGKPKDKPPRGRGRGRGPK